MKTTVLVQKPFKLEELLGCRNKIYWKYALSIAIILDKLGRWLPGQRW